MADPETAHRVRDEVADVLAYLLQFCEVLGVDLLAALAAKIDRNEGGFRAPRPGALRGSRSRPCSLGRVGAVTGVEELSTDVRSTDPRLWLLAPSCHAE